MVSRFRKGAAFLAVVLTLSGMSALSAAEIRVRPENGPRPMRTADGQVDQVIEPSGVEPIGGGSTLLVVHDKAPELVVVDTETGRERGERLLCSAFPTGLEVGPKWEGLALDDEGGYYVIGSHSGKTDDERGQRAYLVRFRLKGDGTSGPPVVIDDASAVRWRIEPALTQALQKAGLDGKAVGKRKIEGLAIRTRRDSAGKLQRRELVIGLRAPNDRVRAFSADITQEKGPDEPLSLEPCFEFDAGSIDNVPCELTALEYLDSWGGFLVNTATEDDDNAFHGNRLWFVPDEHPDRAEMIYEYESRQKAEGVCLLPGSTAEEARLAITFDNDTHTTKRPGRLQTLRLSRPAR